MKRYYYTTVDRATGNYRDDYERSVKARDYNEAKDKAMQAEGKTHDWDIAISPDDWD